MCARCPSDRRCGEAGWLHRLTWGDAVARPAPPAKPDPAPGVDLTDFAGRCARGLDAGRREGLAGSLGLTAASLEALRVGWSGDHLAWTFPMADAAGRVVGVRLRLPDGRKLSVRGGREGLFTPAGPTPSGPLCVAEGPTDTAALLGLGFYAVGRPSCSGGVRHLTELAARLRPASVVIFADADGPGQDGAKRLKETLGGVVVTPPAKDVREWVRSGATRRDVEALI